MAEFMLLIRNGNPQELSPEEAQQIVQRFIAWARRLREEGLFKGGDELQGNGRVLRKVGGKIVDGPFAETKESIGGYFLIEADNYDHAVEITRDCPAFDHGDWVEIRAISLYQ